MQTRPRQHGGYPFIYCLFPDFKLRPVANIHRATTSMDQIRMQIPRTSTMSVLVKQPLLALVSGSKHVLWFLFEVWLVVVQYFTYQRYNHETMSHLDTKENMVYWNCIRSTVMGCGIHSRISRVQSPGYKRKTWCIETVFDPRWWGVEFVPWYLVCSHLDTEKNMVYENVASSKGQNYSVQVRPLFFVRRILCSFVWSKLDATGVGVLCIRKWTWTGPWGQ